MDKSWCTLGPGWHLNIQKLDTASMFAQNSGTTQIQTRNHSCNLCGTEFFCGPAFAQHLVRHLKAKVLVVIGWRNIAKAWNVCSISGLNLTWLGGYLGGAEPKPWSGKLPHWLLKPEENKTPEIRFSNQWNQMIIKSLLQTQEGTISSVQCQNWRHLLWWQPQDCEWSYTSKSPVKTAQIPSVEKLCKLTNVF